MIKYNELHTLQLYSRHTESDGILTVTHEMPTSASTSIVAVGTKKSDEDTNIKSANVEILSLQ